MVPGATRVPENRRNKWVLENVSCRNRKRNKEKKNASKGIIITKTPGFVRRISFLEPSGLLALYYPSKNILTPAASVAPGSGLKVESGDHRTPALK